MDKRKVTALKIQKRNPNRLNVHLDGEFAFGIARIVGAWLTVGQELSSEKIAELQGKDQFEVALQRAYHFLSYRPRSAAEVTKNLEKHETPEEIIEKVIARLEKNGQVNDLRFAKQWVENRSTFRPRGSFALRVELRQKGVPDRFIDLAVAHIDEEQLAYEAGKLKASKYRTDDENVFRRKLSGFLSRRGFPYDVIHSVVQKIWNEHGRQNTEDKKWNLLS
jgi:regulatory protein